MALPGFDVAAVWLCSVLAADESDIVGRRQEEEKTTSVEDKKKQYKDIKWKKCKTKGTRHVKQARKPRSYASPKL